MAPGLAGGLLHPVNQLAPELAGWIGNWGNNIALTVGLAWLLARGKNAPNPIRWQTVLQAMLLETTLFLAIKALTWHAAGILARPSGTDGGFPSGHTAAHVCLATLFSSAYPKWTWVWYGWAGLMAWSRVSCGAHFGYQVVAGAVLGFAVAFHQLNSDRRRPSVALREQTALQ